MPTTLELPPRIEEGKAPVSVPSPLPTVITASASPHPMFQRALFSDSLLESDTTDRSRRKLATTLSLIFECFMIGLLLILPLMFTEALPTTQLLTFLVAPPPPPPPPPPPAAAPIIKVVQTDVLNNGSLRTPTRIPRKVQMVHEDQAPPPAISEGVIGGVPGGIPGGQLGGVIGGIISSSTKSTAMIPKIAEPVKRVRISQGVTQGLVITKIEPKYPKIALAAHVTGSVVLHAIISKRGEITELQLVNGHPLLVSAAIDAVKQWRYRPYLLNGEPVEVETIVTVNFQLTEQ